MNDQEQFWAGEAGDAYHKRSPGDLESNTFFFRKALDCLDRPVDCRILEFGCGTGTNLLAIRRCFPSPILTGVELNEGAAKIAIDALGPAADIYTGSILEDRWIPRDPQDIAFTKGLLIHIAPKDLPKAYHTLVNASSRYVLVAEYFCPTSRMIPYRGQDDRLWARDFAGELIDAYALKLVDYGFVSKRDQHPQDDLTWWLMEKP